jgi:hypothetical protein
LDTVPEIHYRVIMKAHGREDHGQCSTACRLIEGMGNLFSLVSDRSPSRQASAEEANSCTGELVLAFAFICGHQQWG